MRGTLGRVLVVVLAVVMAAGPVVVGATDFPTRNIELVVPYPPGGS